MVNELKQVELILKDLKAVIEREDKRHQMDEHLTPHTADVVLEVIGMLEDEIDYDPSPHEVGEPPITLSEMHSAAWREHQAMHK